MLKIKIKNLRISYFNYYNKLVFKKNLIVGNNNTKKKKNISIRLKKKTSTNLVTLRAPKHFKVGRHHYEIIKTLYLVNIKDFMITIQLPKNLFYLYVKTLLNLLKKKKLSKLLSILLRIRVTLSIKDNFYII